MSTMSNLVCTFCGVSGWKKENSLKQHMAHCMKKKFLHVSESYEQQVIAEVVQDGVARKNIYVHDDDNDSLYFMEEDNDDLNYKYKKEQSDDASTAFENNYYNNKIDTINDDMSNQEEEEKSVEAEQVDFDAWFAQQLDIEETEKEAAADIDDNFGRFLDNITSTSLMDYENEIRKKTEHMPPIPPEMNDAIQLLSLLSTSKASFSLYEKIVKWRQISKSSSQIKKCLPERK
jgi:hypothetical protein